MGSMVTSSGSNASTAPGEVMMAAPKADVGNRYTVDVRDDGTGQGTSQGTSQGTRWSVAIVDPDGNEAAVRACRDETEARAFASTVRQHVGWLSEERFREIYRLDGA